jgi:hypothetical protein
MLFPLEFHAAIAMGDEEKAFRTEYEDLAVEIKVEEAKISALSAKYQEGAERARAEDQLTSGTAEWMRPNREPLQLLIGQIAESRHLVRCHESRRAEIQMELRELDHKKREAICDALVARRDYCVRAIQTWLDEGLKDVLADMLAVDQLQAKFKVEIRRGPEEYRDPNCGLIFAVEILKFIPTPLRPPCLWSGGIAEYAKVGAENIFKKIMPHL